MHKIRKSYVYVEKEGEKTGEGSRGCAARMSMVSGIFSLKNLKHILSVFTVDHRYKDVCHISFVLFYIYIFF